MKVLVTGSAGFIGSALSIRLLDRGDTVVGIDNHNDYYDPKLKEARLARHADHSNYTHIRMNLEDRDAMARLFKDEQFDTVVNLAAQAGVRYSIENPLAYIDTNLVGFAHILEGCRHNKVGHLVYASSSSTYGLNTKQPFSTHEAVNHPVSLYAATKIANELNWTPDETFETGIKKTVEWYLDNKTWCDRVKDGSYQGERLGVVKS